MALEDAVFPGESFDMIFSSLTLHYIKSYHMLIHNVYQWLRPGGHFVFSVEHPVFTAEGKQSWICDEEINFIGLWIITLLKEKEILYSWESRW